MMASGTMLDTVPNLSPDLLRKKLRILSKAYDLHHGKDVVRMRFYPNYLELNCTEAV